MASPKFKWPRFGTCRVCGCVHARACATGCSWVDKGHTLCSACSGMAEDLAYTVGWCMASVRKYGLAGDVLLTNTIRQRDVLRRFRERAAQGLPLSRREAGLDA